MTHTKGELCKDCQWEHTADSVKGTSFMGVRLCPLHSSTTDLLEACKEAHKELKTFCMEISNTTITNGMIKLQQAINKAENTD